MRERTGACARPRRSHPAQECLRFQRPGGTPGQHGQDGRLRVPWLVRSGDPVPGFPFALPGRSRLIRGHRLIGRRDRWRRRRRQDEAAERRFRRSLGPAGRMTFAVRTGRPRSRPPARGSPAPTTGSRAAGRRACLTTLSAVAAPQQARMMNPVVQVEQERFQVAAIDVAHGRQFVLDRPAALHHRPFQQAPLALAAAVDIGERSAPRGDLGGEKVSGQILCPRRPGRRSACRNQIITKSNHCGSKVQGKRLKHVMRLPGAASGRAWASARRGQWPAGCPASVGYLSGRRTGRSGPDRRRGRGFPRCPRR